MKTSFDSGKTSIRIYAKEAVPLCLRVNDESSKEYVEKHRQLVEHGKDIEIGSSAITVEGSKLFDEIFGSGKGTLRISSPKIHATQKIWLVNKDTQLIELFDDIHGQVSFGNKSFTFDGRSCNGLFGMSYQKYLDEKGNKANVNISLCFDQWEGVILNYLPYFEKLLSLFEKMANGWELFTSLEINGTKILSSVGMDVSSWEYVIETASFLGYVNRCRIISNTFHFDIKYTSNVSYSAAEHNYIAEVVAVIEGRYVLDEKSISSNASCHLIADEGCMNVKALLETTEVISIRSVDQVGDDVEIFGAEYRLPARTISLYSVLPKIHGKLTGVKCGDEVKIEWVPQKDFHCTFSYEEETADNGVVKASKQ